MQLCIYQRFILFFFCVLETVYCALSKIKMENPNLELDTQMWDADGEDDTRGEWEFFFKKKHKVLIF